MITKPKHEMSYKSFIENLIIGGFIPEKSIKISQSFIDSETKLIKDKKSKLPSNMRAIILALGDTKSPKIVLKGDSNEVLGS